MAAALSRVDELVSQNCTVSDVKQQSNCNDCVKYECELEELTQELSSAKKIIQLLQEELNTRIDPMVARTSTNGRHSYVSSNFSSDFNNNNWVIVTDKSRKPKKLNRTSLDQPPIPVKPLTNRYHALHNLQHDTVRNTFEQAHGKKIPTIINGTVTSNQDKDRHKDIASKQHTGLQGPKFSQHTVQLIGDSHLSDSATRINQYLPSNYEASGFIQPGATSKHIVTSCDNEFQSLGEKDVIVLSCGANDVGKVNSTITTVITPVIVFSQKYLNTNIIVLEIPHRHNLHHKDMTNMRIQALNTKLKSILSRYKHVTILDMDMTRKYFTRHGLHLNNLGKDLLARKIAFQIDNINKRTCRNEDDLVMCSTDSQIEVACVSQVNNIHASNQSIDNSVTQLNSSQNDKLDPNDRVSQVSEVLKQPSMGEGEDAANSANDVMTGQSEVVNTYAEILIQETNKKVRVNENSENKKETTRGRLVNDSVVMQNQEGDDMDPDVAQASSTYPQSNILDDNQGPGKTKNGVRDERDPTEHQNDNIQVQENNSRQPEKEAVVKASRRIRKTPVTRSEDFLWTTTSKIQAR
jgi:hypothetical protein